VAAGLGFWLVRVGLRPLDEMVDTADAIALGDIDRRIDASGGGREVVRLAHALNGAFDARQTSEETLRQFVADASHELRTPLTSIRGYAELLRAGAVPDAEDADRAVRRIEAEAARMGVLVEDLLLLARMDQGRPLRREQVDLTIVAADAAADAKAVEPDRPVTLSAREPVLVTGDEARLRQVLSNLLANVRDHTPAGTPVDVSVRREGEAGVVEVADHGPGIPADAAEHAFDRFWRVDPARTHRTGAAGGAGLGLSIVAAIAAAHGGKVALSTTPGGGATFTVTIPCTLPEDGPSAPSAASTDGPPAATGSPPDAAG
jgi:two-component system OmpR family sensor kinase